MTNPLFRIAQLLERCDGQDLLEYAMLVGLIAIVAVASITTVGNTINQTLWQVIAASNV
jgi:Flp pilus assembly pilin Flp